MTDQSSVRVLPAEPSVERSLAKRVGSAAILLILAAVFYALGRDAFFGLVVPIVLMSLFELVDALGQWGRRVNAPLALLAGLAMLVVAYLGETRLIVVVLALTMMAAFLLALRPGRGGSAITDVAWTLLAVAWIGGGGAGAVSILMIDDGGLNLLLGFVAAVVLADTGAFFVGGRFGRHKMAPSISPAKSWEGFVGGLCAAVGTGALLAWLLDELPIVDGLAIGAICGVVGPVGDLVESLVKREIGIKDSGRLLPGHGGFLDLIDAIVFCAPGVALYLRFVVV